MDLALGLFNPARYPPGPNREDPLYIRNAHRIPAEELWMGADPLPYKITAWEARTGTVSIMFYQVEG